MTHRIEPVATLPGMLTNASTYSLALDDDALYIVRLGPALGAIAAAGSGASAYRISDGTADDMIDRAVDQIGEALGQAMAAPVVKAMGVRFDKKIDAALDRLDQVGHEVMAREKKSYRLGMGDVESVTKGRKGTWETQTFKTSARKFVFRVEPYGVDQMEEFAAAVRSWAGI